MSGYIETGYIAAIGSLSLYGATLLRREALSRRRLSRLGVVVGSRKSTPTSPVVADNVATDKAVEEVTES